MSEYLSLIEVYLLTDALTTKAQDVWLTQREIPHKVDGKRIILSRQHVTAWLEDKPVLSTTVANWGSVT
jgi:hypothetical protein